MGWSEYVTVLWIFAVIIIPSVATETQFANVDARTTLDESINAEPHSLVRMHVGDKESIQSSSTTDVLTTADDCREGSHFESAAPIRQRNSVFPADIFPRESPPHWNNAYQHTSDVINPDALAINGPSFMGDELSTPKGQADAAGSRVIADGRRQNGKQRRAVIDYPTTAWPQNKNHVDVRSTTDPPPAYHSQTHAEPIRISSMAPGETTTMPTPFTDELVDAINTTASSIGDDNEFSNTTSQWSDYPTELLTANFTELSDHSEKCVGDITYCNDTLETYMSMLNEYITPKPPEWILIFAHAVVFFMGLVKMIYIINISIECDRLFESFVNLQVGNALVCMAVYTNYTMRTVTNIFIVNLAVADFLVILFCLPPTVVWDVTETWFLGKTMCKIVMYFQVRLNHLLFVFV